MGTDFILVLVFQSKLLRRVPLEIVWSAWELLHHSLLLLRLKMDWTNLAPVKQHPMGLKGHWSLLAGFDSFLRQKATPLNFVF